MNDDFISRAFLAGVSFAFVWLTLLVAIPGCDEAQKYHERNKAPQHATDGAMVKVYHYQGCEYLKFETSSNQPAIHSATCCNPQHCK